MLAGLHDDHSPSIVRPLVTARVSSPAPQDFVPRSVCARCERPSVVCVCATLSPLQTRTRVVMLQHPRESDVPINTARLVELQLERAELHVGIRLGEVPELRARLDDPGAPPILLYPGEGARDLAEAPPPGPVTLVVLDGTWWQAKKLFQHNPELARLPRYGLSPTAPSRYRIRREPALHCISTIEAIGEALALLEPGGFDREALLRPFDAMVEHQLRYAEQRSARRHLAFRERARKPRLPRQLLERAHDLVVGYGEANAWPRGSELGGDAELLHWVAERVTTGERFEAILAPRRALSPSFSAHTRVPAELVLAGESVAEFRRRWLAFRRPADLLAGWGSYGTDRLVAEGVDAPERLELRELARRQLRRSTGEVSACAQELGAVLPEPWARGRAGERLTAAVAVTRALLSAAGYTSE
jgi:DTW domain-containing protein